jgi:hypothetical protein
VQINLAALYLWRCYISWSLFNAPSPLASLYVYNEQGAILNELQIPSGRTRTVRKEDSIEVLCKRKVNVYTITVSPVFLVVLRTFDVRSTLHVKS